MARLSADQDSDFLRTDFHAHLNLNLAWAEVCDLESGEEGKNPLSAEERKSKKESNNPRRKRFGRALLFNGGFVLLSSLKYWVKYSKWIEDWQYELNWEDQKRRFFTLEANKFDSNPFITNWSHNLAGGIYYTFARYHHLSSLESLLFTTITSIWWEYVTEWREVVSVNDNIFTGIGGISIGEPLFQISNYYSSRRGFFNKILGFIFDPVVTVNDLLGGHRVQGRYPIPEKAKPRFTLYFGQKQAFFRGEGSRDTDLLNLRIETCYNTIPGYGDTDTGSVSRPVKDTLLSEVHFDFTFGADSVEEYQFFTRAVVFGHFRQEIRRNAANDVKGYSLFFGAGSAFDLFKKKALAYYDKGEYHYDFTAGEKAPQPTEFTDKLAVMNLIGPVFDLSVYSKHFKLKLFLEAYFDFALVHSMAVNEYSKIHDLFDPKMKTTLAHYGYHYAFGFTLSSAADMIYRNIEIGARIKYQYYDSVEGLDRFQDRVVDDCNVTDSRLMYRLSLAYHLSRSPAAVVLTWEGIDRRGTLKEITHQELETRFYSQLRFSF